MIHASTAVFVYGSLMHPTVMAKVAGAPVRMQPAVLRDFRRGRIVGELFPGVIPLTGSEVPGCLAHAMTGEQLARLDAFEEDFYRRETHPVVCDYGRTVSAEVYVVAQQHQARVSADHWDYRAFAERDLQAFIAQFLENA